MIRNLRDTTLKNTEQDWLKTNLAKFSRLLQGQKDMVAVGQMLLSELAPVVGAQQGEFYVVDSAAKVPHLKLLASYASGGLYSHGRTVALGEGLIGQCAMDRRKILLEDVSGMSLRISTGLSESTPHHLLILPVVFEGAVRGVLELATLERLNPTHQTFLDQLAESIGIVINTIDANMRTEALLEQSQSLATELQSRQQELQTTNNELQEKAQLLVEQNREVESKNREVEQARQALEEKAEQLARTSRYKSDFLANMSHELRTPLNSLLILSDQLCQNKDGNLSPKQVEFSKTIHSSGNDLLTLINDILDLSKIESGTVVADISELNFDDLHRYCERAFRHVAESKNLDFTIIVDPRLPKSMITDAKRLQQILKNLLSNAFKFTNRGSVSLAIEWANSDWRPAGASPDLEEAVAFRVNDTGIGISSDKQRIIFEAFQQADGSTSRKYGGTGLGLAISRELSRLLGGEIQLTSSPGQGSTFTLFLPMQYSSTLAGRKYSASEQTEEGKWPPRPDAFLDVEGAAVEAIAADVLLAKVAEPNLLVNEVDDDRDAIRPGDRVALIVENDLAFAKVLLDVVREKGCKGLVTSLGAAALALARDFTSDFITLDLKLPDMDGWRVIARLKGELSTRHIPICVISTEESRERAFEAGAVSFVAKPIQSKDDIDAVLSTLLEIVQRRGKRVLVAARKNGQLQEISKTLANANLEFAVTSSQEEFLAAVRSVDVDCAVIEAPFTVDLADVNRVRGSIRPHFRLPVIIFGVETALASSAPYEALTLKQVRSRERLIDWLAFVLHSRVTHLTKDQNDVLRQLHESDRTLSEKTALVVDDDIRNVYALASLLEDHGMIVVSANNGPDALRTMCNRDLDVVLMDIMMPEMDGISIMREARSIASCRDVPIIAVTAKAMKGDRERCIEAGAWDYLSKPVDPKQLLAVLRAWLYR
jgi:signal transduction histidine kinase/DNA-binding response OmpR family regulator